MNATVEIPMTQRPAGVPARLPGALIVGGDYQALGLVRSLGPRKIPICVIDDEHSIARFSRYVQHSVRVPDLRNEDRAIEAIVATGRRLGLRDWILFPTRDETMAAFSRHRSRLQEFFRVPTPEWSTINWAWDKRNTYRLATELGIAVPRTWYPQHRDDLQQIDAAPPYALKPAIKEHFIYQTKAKAWRANSREELLQLYDRAARFVPPGEMMVQDVVPGDGRQQFSYCAFFKDGEAVGSMVTRRTRQHPREFGRASTYVETLDHPYLEEISAKFLRAINYYGLVELEYKLDPRDNIFRLLDFNGRSWGYNLLGAAAGVDFAHLLYKDQCGESTVPCRARAGVKWIRLMTDLPTGLLQIAGGHTPLFQYLDSVRRSNVEAVFRLKDPLPSLVETALAPYLFFKRGF